jgi:hypothetical protein
MRMNGLIASQGSIENFMDTLEIGSEQWPNLPEKWDYVIQLTPAPDGQFGGALELTYDAILKCRIVLAHLGTDQIVAHRHVRQRAERWMADWVARQPDGSIEK